MHNCKLNKISSTCLLLWAQDCRGSHTNTKRGWGGILLIAVERFLLFANMDPAVAMASHHHSSDVSCLPPPPCLCASEMSYFRHLWKVLAKNILTISWKHLKIEFFFKSTKIKFRENESRGTGSEAGTRARGQWNKVLLPKPIPNNRFLSHNLSSAVVKRNWNSAYLCAYCLSSISKLSRW
jgi:hypothetical protein